ncbi:MAG: alkaline phosphatase family protein [Thermoanaerobaculia bacterium]|nr:alkaline phosphatase family protein [Thermoanaerobaculia bacterium]
MRDRLSASSYAFRLGFTFLTTIFLVAAAVPAAAQDGAGDRPKTIVLGFDGVDADLTARWMDEGELPNLAKLRDQGTFSPLMPTIPSQTPVSWSTFATGLDPGRHGVFDFLRRDPDTYRPQLGLINEGRKPLLWGERNPLMLGIAAGLVLTVLLLLIVRPLGKSGRRRSVALGVTLLLSLGSAVAVSRAVDAWIPDELPTAENPRQGEAFWQLLGDAGIRARVLRLPQNFPPKPFENGQLLTGLGTPDLSLRVGKPFYFTSELFFQAEGGGDFSLEMVELIDNKGEIPTEIKGPPNKLFPGEKLSYLTLPMTLNVLERERKLRIRVGEAGEQVDITLAAGEWSDWEHFEFAYNPLLSMAGIGRFHVLSIEPEVRLYLSPIQFDPHNLPPSFQLSHPHEFAADLTQQHGYYKTMGWAVDTWSLDEGTIDEELFLDDVEKTVTRFEQMLQDQLVLSDWDVLVHYFEFTDRVQHMMFRLFDPEHPRYDEELAAKYGDSVLKAYQRMDAIVGGVMEAVPEARLFVVSDHGFSSWRWSMNYNTWLVKNGYMRLNGQDAERMNLEDLFDQGDFFVNVDWSQTRAYALGFGNIFINLEGRERDGIVPQEEYEALRDEIRYGLLNFVHVETGLNPVAHIFFREEAYESFDRRVMPDMIATNADYYRAGWQDTLGGIATAIVEPNNKRWSGDHCSLYPPLVEGILFSNQRLDLGDGPYMGDIAPTLLSMYGVEASVELDGKSLLR